MTEEVQKKKRGRPLGSKNKPKPRFQLYKDARSLQDAARIYIQEESAESLEKVVKDLIKRALTADDKSAHHYHKLLLSRLVPELKQVEHVGDLDARGGITINIAEANPKSISALQGGTYGNDNAATVIGTHAGNGREPHGVTYDSGSHDDSEQPEPVHREHEQV